MPRRKSGRSDDGGTDHGEADVSPSKSAIAPKKDGGKIDLASRNRRAAVRAIRLPSARKSMHDGARQARNGLAPLPSRHPPSPANKAHLGGWNSAHRAYGDQAQVTDRDDRREQAEAAAARDGVQVR
jgi:hypothetical protein